MQVAETEQIAVSCTPEELTEPQFEAVVGSQTTTLAYWLALVAKGTGVVTTIGESDCAAIFTLSWPPAPVG